MKKISLIILFTLCLTACDAFDPYAVKFNQVTITNTKQSVINTMGAQPDSSTTLELPLDSLLLPKVEQLSWKTRIANRVYITVFLGDRLLAKVVI
jgi:PBP1b-binding outer membrane lipoprotein LpoB